MNIRRHDRLASQTVRFGYTVTGETAFPLDMLRYEAAYPASQLDTDNILASLTRQDVGRRTINLLTTRDVNWLPLQSRWRQHGWRVE